MALSEDLLTQRKKLENEILALESTLGNGSNIADLLSSDSDSAEESDDSGHADRDVAHEDLEAERQQIQREIEELERTLGADAALVDALTDSEHGSLTDSNDEESDEDLDLPQDLETCLQMNLVYQEVLNEKLADLERLLKENREQQKELEEQLSGPSYISPGLPHLKLFLGSFMKPYFKDKLTGLGPPANEETKERLTHGTKPCDEMKIRRWEPWQKTLLNNSVVTDTMKRMLQPKLSKMEYLTAKMSKAADAEKKELQNQIALLEKDITEIRSMKEDQLYGNCHDDHDWDKISNIDFEGLRQPDDLMRFWQNYLHPSINKSTWSQDEIAKLADVVEKYMCCHWDQIAESLGTNRTAFMCFQTYQRYISKQFRKREWTKEEDQVFRELVDKMRIGNFIPYTQISYFMEARDSSQLIYRWTCVLDPAIKKGPWTKDEDRLLLNAVKKYGCKEWWKIRLEVPGRTDNSCRDRYLDCLRDDIKRGTWSDEEVELLTKLVEKYGVGKWSKIASEIPNRVDSQCLNKWKWMMQSAEKKGVKRGRVRESPVKREPQLKRRCVSLKKVKKENEEEDFQTESDTSEDEKEQVPYMDSDGEQAVENVSSDEDSKLEYVQPDMKEWIPARGNRLAHSPGKLKTVLVRMPTEAEESAGGCVRNTVLDTTGKPVKTYVGMKPPTLQKRNSSDEPAMIMVSESDVKHMLICMRASVMKVRTPKPKTRLSSRTNRNDAKNDEEEDKSEIESSQRRRCKSVPKAVATTQLSYDLMLAITPWVGNVLMPLSFSERRVCEADIVRKRAADVPLVKSSVFLFFLQALKVDTDGCKKVIEARRDKVSLTPGPESRRYSAKKPTPGSYCYIKTVADILAERTEHMEHSRPLQSPEFLEPQLLPQPAKIAIPPRSRQERKTKQDMQSASQTINATLILPQNFVVAQPNTDNKVGTSNNVVQGTTLLQLGTQDVSKIPQPGLNLAKPVESGRVTQPASCPTTSVSTTGPPTETLEDTSSPRRKHKPTMKAQALMDNKRAKLAKKQAAKKQQNSNVTQTVAVLPQTTAWILTPAGLMPVAGIRIQAPGIPGNQNQVVFQQPIIVNQNGSLAIINTAEPCLANAPRAATANVSRVPTNSAVPNINKSLPTSSTEGRVICSAYSIIPTSAPSSAVNGTSHATPQSSVVNSPVTISVGGLPTDQWCVNSLTSPMTTSCQILTQTVAQQMPPQAEKQTVYRAATTSNPRPKQMTFDPSLTFFEQPDQVKNWLKGNGGITLPGLEDKMPYLPPFVSSINTLTTLLKGRDSLLKSAVQLLPEEHRDNSEEEAKIAAVRKMVSERFQTNQAYLLLKARFLSCFTLPALLATINPCTGSADAVDQEDNMDKVKPTQFEDEDQIKALDSLLNMKESELTAAQFPGSEPRNQTDTHTSA
ncbi:hypothetical protein PDJAM_G00146260 [Pangasius djambal]|uniref:Uncharacterized protein n=1 Tax=Pangasius djambal TaxID=1691987 RepID=A0ACC5ZHP7_9TELE|nr:hypothetical protein [Pangasius djambal]